MTELKKGDRVRMGDRLKWKLRKNGSGEHVREFGDCVGVVDGPVDWQNGDFGPELDVRWQPSNLRYMYAPDDLVREEED